MIHNSGGFLRMKVFGFFILLSLFIFPGDDARADVCITNKSTYPAEIDIKCGISNLDIISKFTKVSDGDKICKNNKILKVIPTPCIVKITNNRDTTRVTLPFAPHFSYPLTGITGNSLVNEVCTIGPTYSSHTIGENFLVPRQRSNILGKCRTTK
jgi:hypothetical protein